MALLTCLLLVLGPGGTRMGFPQVVRVYSVHLVHVFLAPGGKDGLALVLILAVGGLVLMWWMSRTEIGQEISWSRFKHDYLPFWKVTSCLPQV